MTARRPGPWVLLLAVFAASPAAGAPCGSSARPWVSVAFDAASFGKELEARMLADFRAGLSDRDIDACAQSDGPDKPAVAAIRIAQATATRVGVSVEVRDAVTEKRVARDVDLSSVPRDGRAFAVALAADELLRASWVELAIERSRRPKRPPPPEVVAVAASTLPPRRERPFRLGLRAAAERFSGGQTQLGADAALVTPLSERLQLDVSAGLREALDVTAPRGSVVASAFGAGVTLNYLLVASSGFELALGAGGRAAWARFRGEAEGDAVESELSGFVAYARASLGAAARIAGPVWAELGGTLGAPLRTLGARDGDDVVTGMSGLELAARLGLAAEF